MRTTALDRDLAAWFRRPHLPLRARAWWPVLSLLGFVAVVALTEEDVPCTTADPCAPDPVLDVALGVLPVSAALSAVGGWAAVAATAAAALAGSGPDDDPVVLAALLGHVAVQAAVVRARSRAVRPRWPTGTTGTTGTVPVGGRGRAPGRVGAAAALAAALAAGLVLAGVLLQARADAEQAVAPRLDAVVETWDAEGFRVGVRLEDGQRVQVDVLDVEDHPVGSSTVLWRLPDGALRPVGEPYEAWGAFWAAGAAGAVGVALLGRRLRARGRHRRWATGPVPLLAARARVLPWAVLVHPVDAGPLHEPVLAVPLDVDVVAPLLGLEPVDPDRDDLDEVEREWERWAEDDDELPPVVDVLLAGVPRPGEWCAVGVAAEHLAGSTGTGTVWLAPDGPAVDLGGPVLDPAARGTDGVAVLEVPAGDLAAADRDGSAVREHRLPRAVALVVLVPAFVLGVTGLDGVADALGEGPVRALAPAVLGLLALEASWRAHLRPRLAWDGRGLTWVGSFGPARWHRWDDVVDVTPGVRGQVVVETVRGGRRSASCADPWLPAAVRRGWRTPEELRAALLLARERGRRRALAPLVVPTPSRPWAVWALWLLVVVVAALVVGV